MAAVLRRRAPLLAAALVFGLAAGVAILAVTPKRWDAEAVVALDARRIQAAPSDSLVSRLPNEAAALRTELDVIHSRRMAEQVLSALEPDMRSRLASAEWRETRRDRIVGLLAGLVGTARAVDAAGADAEEAHEAAIAALQDNLRATNDNRSFTIFFAYSAPDPVAAADIANAYARAYLAHRTSSQTDATDQVREMLGERVAILREQVSALEGEVEARRREAGLIDPEGLTLQERRVAALNLELAAARSARATAEARLASVKDAVAVGGAAASEALSTDAVVALRRQRDDLRSEAAEIERAGALRSERLRSLRAGVADLDARIAAEIERVVANLESEASFARSREAELESTLARMETRALEIEAARGAVRRLEREASASREIYDAFVARYKQAIEQTGLAVADATLITPAQVAGAPAVPRIGPTLALALFAGLSGGVGLALAAERLDGRVRSVGETEIAAQAPVLARIPFARFSKPHVAVLAGRAKPNAAAIESLRAALTLSSRTRAARVLNVTSPGVRAGRSTVATALARSVALAGGRVALVDADGRRSELQGVFGPPGPDGLRRDPKTGVVRVDLQQPGAEIPVGGPEFEDLLRRLRKDFDLVLIDSPAIADGADAVFASALSDATLLVVRWGRTTYDQTAAAARELALCGVPLAGVVLNAAPSETIRRGVDVDYRPAVDFSRLGHQRDDGHARLAGGPAPEGLRIVAAKSAPKHPET